MYNRYRPTLWDIVIFLVHKTLLEEQRPCHVQYLFWDGSRACTSLKKGYASIQKNTCTLCHSGKIKTQQIEHQCVPQLENSSRPPPLSPPPHQNPTCKSLGRDIHNKLSDWSPKEAPAASFTPVGTPFVEDFLHKSRWLRGWGMFQGSVGISLDL